MRLRNILPIPLCSFGLLLTGSNFMVAQQQRPAHQLNSVDLDRAHSILHQTYEEVKRSYYDPAFHGVDLDNSYRQMDARLNASQTVNDSFHVIAAFLMQLHDSHTFFQPPQRVNRSTMGYEMEMVGEKCFITHIRPGTDAATKLHAGDQVLAINHFGLRRADFINMRYFFQTLSPAPSEMLEVETPEGERRQVVVQATLRPGRKILDLTDEGSGDFWQLVRADEEDDHLNRQRFSENGDVLVWKMPSFEVAPENVDKMLWKARAHKELILDLRGNPGGAEDTLKDMIGHMFDHDITVATRVSRKDSKTIVAKDNRGQPFTGKLIVLIDSESGSAAELFARVIQLEKRGTVIGDQSAGAVMEAHDFYEQTGADPAVIYGLSVTAANLLMGDGKSLENVGVTPDEKLLPSADELASGQDPILSRALDMAGVKMDATAAGKLFPYEWPTL